MEYTHVTHSFEPIYDENSRILILGSFPSVKSRENQFYYGHPQNRFWKVIAAVCEESVPVDITQKKALLKRNYIALWDVIQDCDIVGSSDASIKNVIGNDMNVILKKAPVKHIFTNGDKAYQLYLKYCIREGQPTVSKLPSTSPANAAWKLERLIETWRAEIKQISILHDR